MSKYKTMKRPICMLLIIALLLANTSGIFSVNNIQAADSAVIFQAYFEEVNVTPVATGVKVDFNLTGLDILKLTAGTREFRVGLGSFAPEAVTPASLEFNGARFAEVSIKDGGVFIKFLEDFFNINYIVAHHLEDKQLSGSFLITGSDADKEIPVKINSA